MGAFFPAGLLAAVDGWILDANPLHVAWHTALPDTSGSNEYSLNGAARLPTGTLATSSDATTATATTAAEIISARRLTPGRRSRTYHSSTVRAAARFRHKTLSALPSRWQRAKRSESRPAT